MTTEEKYKEIVTAREASSKQPEDTPKGGDEKANPQAEKTVTEEGKKPEEKKPEGQPKGDGEQNPKQEAPKEDPKDHAFAQMRFENTQLKKRLKALEDAQKAKPTESKPQEKEKTLEDFNGNVAEYGKYIREKITAEVTGNVTKTLTEKQERETAQQDFSRKLKEDLVKSFGQQKADSVLSDLGNPESVMSQILMDEGAKAIAEAIAKSSRKADLLALMQAKPQLFQDMMGLDARRQEYRIYALEDAIESKYRELASKQKKDEEKKAVADSLPTTGTFGVNGNGTTDISTLSDKDRVARYKAEMLKTGRRF